MTKSGLTEAQVTELASRLQGSGTNVYRLGELLFSREIGEDVFEDLETEVRRPVA